MRGRSWRVWAVVFLSASMGAFMAYDGLRALLVGDYVTPSSGPYEGQLGPWAPLVESVGIPPRSTFMKAVFVLWGAATLATAAFFLTGRRRSWHAMLGACVASLWYLMVGTVACLAAIVLLLTPKVRRTYLASTEESNGPAS